MTSRSRRLDALRQAASALAPEVARLAVRIAEVPAPTGAEHARAAFVARLLTERGYSAEIDELGNVYARRGNHGGATLMLAAHTDTVFPAGTPLAITHAKDRLTGPGIGDNSVGVAALIGLLVLLDQMKLDTSVDLLGVATVGEEGLGNLAGAREAVRRYGDSLSGFVAVEGHNLGRVTCSGVGSQRWRVVVRGPGGHSWGAYGQPSAIHGLARIVAALAQLQPPANPKTTFNVGVIEGGVSVNTIAPSASALLDMRSISPDALARFVAQVRSVIERTQLEGLTVEIEVIGERPAGSTARDSALVVAAANALREVGISPVYDASSTDANIAMSHDIPAICVGISRGGNGHTIDEFIETGPIADGLIQLALIVDAAGRLPAGTRA